MRTSIIYASLVLCTLMYACKRSSEPAPIEIQDADFGEQQIIATNAYAVFIFTADLDGDGDLDVLTPYTWYENKDGNGTFGDQNVIHGLPQWPESAFASDLDGDGDQDVLSGSKLDGWYRLVCWYENTDGSGTFGDQQIIDTNGLATCICASDLDGDGDMDVLTPSSWYENTDGSGTFGPEQSLPGSCWYPNSVCTSDIDNDGDQDILVATDVLTGGDCLLWYENIDGLGTFEKHDVCPASFEGDYGNVHARDFDGDGDQDVLVETQGKIAWYENTDGNGTFGDQQIIAGEHSSFFPVDLDGDGDQDMLLASDEDNIIVWYENLYGNGAFGDHDVIAYSAYGAFVCAADLDGDGDQDILWASAADAKIAWHQNLINNGIGE
jgi:hypothetical protein